MAPELPTRAREAADRARGVLARLRPTPTEGRRSLPIRAEPDHIRRLWDSPETKADVLDGMPTATEATIALGQQDGDWGTVTTLELKLTAPLPGIAAQTLAGKAVRRLKALAETGETPTTAHNPSARPDAGDAT